MMLSPKNKMSRKRKFFVNSSIQILLLSTALFCNLIKSCYTFKPLFGLTRKHTATFNLPSQLGDEIILDENNSLAKVLNIHGGAVVDNHPSKKRKKKTKKKKKKLSTKIPGTVRKAKTNRKIIKKTKKSNSRARKVKRKKKSQPKESGLENSKYTSSATTILKSHEKDHEGKLNEGTQIEKKQKKKQKRKKKVLSIQAPIHNDNSLPRQQQQPKQQKTTKQKKLAKKSIHDRNHADSNPIRKGKPIKRKKLKKKKKIGKRGVSAFDEAKEKVKEKQLPTKKMKKKLKKRAKKAALLSEDEITIETQPVEDIGRSFAMKITGDNLDKKASTAMDNLSSDIALSVATKTKGKDSLSTKLARGVALSNIDDLVEKKDTMGKIMKKKKMRKKKRKKLDTSLKDENLQESQITKKKMTKKKKKIKKKVKPVMNQSSNLDDNDELFPMNHIAQEILLKEKEIMKDNEMMVETEESMLVDNSLEESSSSNNVEVVEAQDVIVLSEMDSDNLVLEDAAQVIQQEIELSMKKSAAIDEHVVKNELNSGDINVLHDIDGQHEHPDILGGEEDHEGETTAFKMTENVDTRISESSSAEQEETSVEANEQNGECFH